jgi:hypothetical protein
MTILGFQRVVGICASGEVLRCERDHMLEAEGSWQRRVFAAASGDRLLAVMRTCIVCLHFSYPDSIRTTGRARRFLRCIPSQVCFELLLGTGSTGTNGSSY